MSTAEPRTRAAGTLLSLIVSLLNSDIVALSGVLWRMSRRILTAQAHEGIYEVLEYEARLDIRDTKGAKAVLYKRQKVRFLQDNIIGYQDTIWGAGDVFADYKIAPGVVADRYREGHRWRVLISLRETRNRGDEAEFHIERTAHNSLTKTVEDFQTEIDHKTRNMRVSIIFPRKRPPKSVVLIEQNTRRNVPLGPEHKRALPDGRVRVEWRSAKPHLFEAYILRWEW